eukprot:UN20005
MVDSTETTDSIEGVARIRTNHSPTNRLHNIHSTDMEYPLPTFDAVSVSPFMKVDLDPFDLEAKHR